MPGVGQAIVAAVFMGVLSTLGDLVWALWIPRHRMVFGLIHGATLFLFLGILLGAFAGGGRRIARGAAGALLAGLAGAVAFYVLAPWVGYGAMFPAWMLLWILLAVLDGRLRGRSGPGGSLGRGIVAAVLSGLAFWAISGIWFSPSPGGPSYGWNLIAWTVAFLPGMLALLTGAPAGDGEAG